MHIHHKQDFWSGILFIAAGAFFIYFAQEHDMGTASRMGPAYFPTVLGGLLSALGALVALRGLLPITSTASAESGDVEPVQWRVLLLVLGSVLVFSLLLPFCGLMAALAAMIIIAALADPSSRFKEVLVLIVVLDVLAYVIFVWGIGMHVAVWPEWLI